MKSLFKKFVIFAITWEAKYVLKKYRPKIVAITGTVGKTSTKDAVYTALSRFVSVRASKKSLNSDFGVPLTILGRETPAETLSVHAWLSVIAEGLKLLVLPNHYPEWLVLEVGADHPGDIRAITEWLKPDVVVITKLSKVPVHVEFFPSVEDVVKEKGYLVHALKSGGTLVLNAEDEDVLSYREIWHGKTILFGLPANSGAGNAPGSDVSAMGFKTVYDADVLPTGIYFNVLAEGEEIPVTLTGTLGEHHVLHILAALAVVQALGENLGLAAKSFRTHEPTPGRMRIIEGKRESTIIDDTYNSSPIAVEEALKTLGGLKAKRRVAVLGDMLELGKYSADAHKRAGQLAAEAGDLLVAVGLRSRYTAETALESGLEEDSVFQFDSSIEAGKFLEETIKKGDAILIKGSQGMRMEQVTEALMAHPEDKGKLLVRQDKEWRVRDKKT